MIVAAIRRVQEVTSVIPGQVNVIVRLVWVAKDVTSVQMVFLVSPLMAANVVLVVLEKDKCVILLMAAVCAPLIVGVWVAASACQAPGVGSHV